MEKLIAVAPSVAELVLEKCVITQPNYQLPDQTETKKVIFFCVLQNFTPVYSS